MTSAGRVVDARPAKRREEMTAMWLLEILWHAIATAAFLAALLCLAVMICTVIGRLSR